MSESDLVEPPTRVGSSWGPSVRARDWQGDVNATIRVIICAAATIILLTSWYIPDVAEGDDSASQTLNVDGSGMEHHRLKGPNAELAGLESMNVNY